MRAWQASIWRRRLLLLSLSVALNIILASYLGAHLLPHPHPHRMEGPLGRMMAGLSDDDQQRFRTALEAGRAEGVAARADIATAEEHLAAAIERVPFDHEAVAAALSQWRLAWENHGREINAAVLAGIASLSDDGRARFATGARANAAKLRTEHPAAAAPKPAN